MKRRIWGLVVRVRTGVALVLLASAGCYHYQPLPVGEVTPDMEIRTRVTAQFAEEVETTFGVSDGRVLEGRVVELLSNGFHLDMPMASELRGIHVETLSQRVRLPEAEIVEVERRELNRFRTAIAAVGGAVVLGSVLYVTVVDPGGEATPPNGGGEVESRSPKRWGIGFRLTP